MTNFRCIFAFFVYIEIYDSFLYENNCIQQSIFTANSFCVRKYGSMLLKTKHLFVMREKCEQKHDKYVGISVISRL